MNAVHAAAPVLARLAAYEPREVDIDGCAYREGLNAVGIAGGVAGNVLPDECRVTVNFRFAPDRSEVDAAEHVRSVFAGLDVEVSIVDTRAGRAARAVRTGRAGLRRRGRDRSRWPSTAGPTCRGSPRSASRR